MSAKYDLERRLTDHYAADAPDRAPDWVLQRVLSSVDSTPQAPTGLVLPWRFRPALSMAKLAITAVAIAAVGLAVTLILRPPLGPAASPAPTASAPSDAGAFEQLAGRIIYCDNPDDHADLWSIDPRPPVLGTQLAPIGLDCASSETPLAWSKDGSKLLFERIDPDHPRCGTISILNADGTRTAVTPKPVGGAAISPDGTRVVFADATSDGLYVADADGRNPVRIADGESPTFSADGMRIAFLARPWTGCDLQLDPALQPGPEHVWVANVDGSDAHEVLADKPDFAEGWFELAWSPSGERIAIWGTHDGGESIWTFAPDGSAFTLVIPVGGHPQWAPDGSQIAYKVHFPAPWGLRLANADGSNVREYMVGAAGPWHP